MVDVTKYYSGQSLHVLREAIPALGCKPVYLAPLDARDPLVGDILSVSGFDAES